MILLDNDMCEKVGCNNSAVATIIYGRDTDKKKTVLLCEEHWYGTTYGETDY